MDGSSGGSSWRSPHHSTPLQSSPLHLHSVLLHHSHPLQGQEPSETPSNITYSWATSCLKDDGRPNKSQHWDSSVKKIVLICFALWKHKSIEQCHPSSNISVPCDFIISYHWNDISVVNMNWDTHSFSLMLAQYIIQQYTVQKINVSFQKWSVFVYVLTVVCAIVLDFRCHDIIQYICVSILRVLLTARVQMCGMAAVMFGWTKKRKEGWNVK